MLRLAPFLAALILICPIVAGLMGTLLPAIGFDPTVDQNSLTLEPFRKLFSTPGIWKSAWLSFIVGISTTIISLVIVIGFFASWHETKFFDFLRNFLSPILSIPHAAAALGFAFLIAPSGWFFRLFSPWLTGIDRPLDLLIVNDPNGLTMIAGLVGKEVPFLFLITLVALPQINVSAYIKISRSLGYGQTAGWLKSLFPLIYQQIRLPILAILVYSTSVVDVSLILGPTTPAPVAARLLTWMNDPDLAMRSKAAAGAIFQLSISIFAIFVWILIEKLASLAKVPLFTDGKRYLSDGFFRGCSAFFMILITLFTTLGLLTLVIWSFSGFWQFPDALPQSFTFKIWLQYLPRLFDLMLTTLLIGLFCILFSIIVIVLCLENETRFDFRIGLTGYLILFLPLLVPQVAFLFGLQILFLTIGMDGTIGSVVLVHMIFVMPYLYLSLSHQWHALDPHFARVSEGLGSSLFKTMMRVRIPILIRTILISCSVGFAVSVSQYLPTLLIGGGRVPTLTTEAVALASGGNRQVIAIHTLVQMMLPFVGFLIAGLIPYFLFRNRRFLQVN